MNHLPRGWKTLTITELGGMTGGKTPSKATASFWSGGTVPWVSPKDMKVFDLAGSEDMITETAVSEAGMALLPQEAVLMVTRSGILAHTFPVAITKTRVTINQDIKAMKPSPAHFLPRYLAYNLRANGPTILATCAKAGTTVASVDSGLLERYPFPFAPLPEQARIVGKLDTVLARVDACRERLDRVPAILRRFRQSVVAAAARGRLTEDWRKGETSTWTQTMLSALCVPDRVITYGVIKLGDEILTGVPCLRTSNVRWLRVDTDGMKRIAPSLSEDYSRTIIRGGEVLVNVRGTLGGVAVATPEMKGWNVSREVAVVPVDQNKVTSAFMALWIAADSSQRWLAKVEKGVAYVGINIEDLRNLPVELPSLIEQAEITRRADQLLAFADRLEARLGLARKAADRLTPVLLAKAFRGELVPQDPDDEPVAELLKDLAEQRSGAEKAAPGRRGKRAIAPSHSEVETYIVE